MTGPAICAPIVNLTSMTLTVLNTEGKVSIHVPVHTDGPLILVGPEPDDRYSNLGLRIFSGYVTPEYLDAAANRIVSVADGRADAVVVVTPDVLHALEPSLHEEALCYAVTPNLSWETWSRTALLSAIAVASFVSRVRDVERA